MALSPQRMTPSHATASGVQPPAARSLRAAPERIGAISRAWSTPCWNLRCARAARTAAHARSQSTRTATATTQKRPARSSASCKASVARLVPASRAALNPSSPCLPLSAASSRSTAVRNIATGPTYCVESDRRFMPSIAACSSGAGGSPAAAARYPGRANPAAAYARTSPQTVAAIQVSVCRPVALSACPSLCLWRGGGRSEEGTQARLSQLPARPRLGAHLSVPRLGVSLVRRCGGLVFWALAAQIDFLEPVAHNDLIVLLLRRLPSSGPRRHAAQRLPCQHSAA